MENNNRDIHNDEVISISNKEDNILMSHHTYKADEFLQRLGERLGLYDKKDLWIVDGVPCQILSPNQNWQSGKIKICVQFIPDRPESVLDDIRKNIEDC